MLRLCCAGRSSSCTASPDVGREVRIAERHLHGGVAHQLLDGLEWYPPHHEVRGEGVPEHVPAERDFLSGTLSDGVERARAAVPVASLAIEVREHASAAARMATQRLQRLV